MPPREEQDEEVTLSIINVRERMDGTSDESVDDDTVERSVDGTVDISTSNDENSLDLEDIRHSTLEGASIRTAEDDRNEDNMSTGTRFTYPNAPSSDESINMLSEDEGELSEDTMEGVEHNDDDEGLENIMNIRLEQQKMLVEKAREERGMGRSKFLQCWSCDKIVDEFTHFDHFICFCCNKFFCTDCFEVPNIPFSCFDCCQIYCGECKELRQCTVCRQMVCIKGCWRNHAAKHEIEERLVKLINSEII